MKLTVKSTKELLAVLDETKEALFKDRKCNYPYSEWEHKRAQVKERLHRLPEYVHQAVEAINIEEQKMGRPPNLTWISTRKAGLKLRLDNPKKPHITDYY